MIANDARAIVYESIKKNRLAIPAHLVKKINDEIVAAAEQMKFISTVQLFSTDNPKGTFDMRNRIMAYYRSLGYHKVRMWPHDGMYELTLEW